jgi:hypothetical protein
MSWDDLPAQPATPSEPAQPAPAPILAKPAASGIRKGIATVMLAAGLLAIGGVAVVNAADPSASPSASPSATDDNGTAPTNDGSAALGRAGRDGRLCPDQGGAGGGGSTDDGTSGSDPSPAPTTVPDSDV